MCLRLSAETRRNRLKLNMFFPVFPFQHLFDLIIDVHFIEMIMSYEL